VNLMVKTQSKFPNLMAIDPADSPQRQAERSESQLNSSKASEIAMYCEMAVALVALSGLLAMAAWVWYLGNSDWLASIHRFQEMI
jgi:hypothetical protein